ncbi:MAG: hypothetical protein HF962_04250 [Sulfurovum sp.]|nr:hypothetical protein [Sulfurovum sp.]
MLDSKYLRVILVGLAFMLLGCGSSKDDKKVTTDPMVNPQPIPKVITKTITLNPTKKNIIQLEGKDNDLMELRFAEQALFAYEQDKLDVNITLTYEGDTLVGFSADKDLVFSKPVYISFDAASLKDNTRFLEYIHASDTSKNYFLPFSIEGDSIVYEFSHFSKYVFHSNDVQDKINVVTLRLQTLNNVTDKKGGLKSIEQQINEVYSLISIIGINDASTASNLQGEANDVVIAYGTAFIDETSYTGMVLQGNCMHPSLIDYINELIYNGSVIAALGASENSLSKSLAYIQDAADAFLDINTTKFCTSPDGMSNYDSCGVDIAEKLVALGDGSGTGSLILSQVEDAKPIMHNGLKYCKVISPHTKKVWLDRNMGASQVCSAFNDASCYGNSYTWEEAVCPVGFRLPSIDELVADTLSNGVIDSQTAFENFLKLPSAGSSNPVSGKFFYVGVWGYLWSGTVDPVSDTLGILFYDHHTGSPDGGSAQSHFFRFGGISVRCIKN